MQSPLRLGWRRRGLSVPGWIHCHAFPKNAALRSTATAAAPHPAWPLPSPRRARQLASSSLDSGGDKMEVPVRKVETPPPPPPHIISGGLGHVRRSGCGHPTWQTYHLLSPAPPMGVSPRWTTPGQERPLWPQQRARAPTARQSACSTRPPRIQARRTPACRRSIGARLGGGRSL